MREKIVKPKETKGKMAGKFFCLVLCAVILGVVAAVSFVVSVPLAERYFETETEAPTIPITIEKDDEPGTLIAAVETMESVGPEETMPEPETKPAIGGEEEVRDIVKDELSLLEWTPEKIRAFGQVLTAIGTEADNSIVTVSSVKQQVDWFDNPVETTGQYAGVILAVNPSEIVILTGEQALKDADSLRILFRDGETAEGTVKQKDTVAGMAAISVNPAELSEYTLERMKVMELGNSYSVKNGDLIIAVGSPTGHVHSVKHGMISYVAKGVQIVDGQSRVFYTDIACSEEKGTFFLNLSGQLIGWATNSFRTEETSDETTIMPISEYKGVLQKLSNGSPIPYLGVKGLEVSAGMQTEGVQKGIYITESIADGPAYLAGIQNGDILTKIQEQDILSIRDFQNRVEALESGAEIPVTIARKGIDAYKEIEYRVIVGAR